MKVNDEDRLFLVTSAGASATRWVSRALASHPDVFTAHGRHPLDSVIKAREGLKDESGDEASFTEGILLADFYQRKSLNEIFAAFKKTMPRAKAWGNVHGFTLKTLMDKVGSRDNLGSIRVLNLVRHPVGFVNSHYNLVRKAEAFPKAYSWYKDEMFKQAQEIFPELALFDNVEQTELLAFSVSCLSLCYLLDDFMIKGFSHVRMEDLTSDPRALGEFCLDLTGLEYDPDSLEEMILNGPVNRHTAAGAKRTPADVFQEWPEWRRDMFLMMVPEEVLEEFGALGYELGFLGWAPQNRAASAEAEEEKDLVEVPGLPEPFSVPEMFRAGNYAAVAMAGRDEHWETFAAMGIIGLTAKALEGLRRFDHDQARFYEGVTLWIGREDARAEKVLEKLDSPWAQKLLALIRKPKIRILAQLPWSRNGASDFLSNPDFDPKFEVKNISFDPRDLPNRPYADIFEYVDPAAPPDFYICKMVEWHLIPPNIQDLPCPIFGHTGDYDLHIQGVYPWLGLFDEMVVTDQTEWHDVSRLIDGPVSTFPKSFGIRPDLPEPSKEDRPIDVFQSGSQLHPYHPDKVSPLMQALRLPEDKKIVTLDGFLFFNDYLNCLNKAKASFTFVRHPGAMPTRGLESLAMGVATAVQKGCCLTLFVGEEEGLVEYGPGGSDLSNALKTILENFPKFQSRAFAGAKLVRKEFSLPLVASQYFRFLTFLASKPGVHARSLKARSLLRQKRMILEKGWLPGLDPVLQLFREKNLELWQRDMEAEITLEKLIDSARELVLEHCRNEAGRQTGRLFPKDDLLLKQAGEIHRKGLACFPDSLVLRFNHIRTMIHFGSPDDVSEALDLAERTLAVPLDVWKIGLMEDVFPWDFFPACFNFRSYFDAIVESIQTGIDVGERLGRLIYASLYYYLSNYRDHERSAALSVKLDPDFPFYRFRLASLLLPKKDYVSRVRTGLLLYDLLHYSLLFNEAYSAAREVFSDGCLDLALLGKAGQVSGRFLDGQKLDGKTGWANFNNSWRLVEMGVEKKSALKKETGINGGDPSAAVGILIPTMNRSEYLERALTYYDRVGFKGFILIGDSSSGEHLDRVRKLLGLFRNRLKMIYRHFPNPPYLHDGMCLKEMIKAAPTPYLVMAGDDDFVIPEGLAASVAFLEENPDFAAAHGYRINFRLEGEVHGRLTEARFDQGAETMADSAADRWIEYMRGGISSQYFVHRTETWARMYREVDRVPSRYLGPELLPCSLTYISGQVKKLQNCVTAVHQVNEDRVFSLSKQDAFALMTTPDWSPSIKVVREALTQALVEADGLEYEKARELVHQELYRHFLPFLVLDYADRKTGRVDDEALAEVGSVLSRLDLAKKVFDSENLAEKLTRDESFPFTPVFRPVLETLQGAKERAGDPEALVALGERSFHQRNFREARELFERVLAEDPGHVRARGNLACVLAQTGQADEAVSEFRTVLKKAPEDRTSVWNLGRMLDDLGRRDEAVDVLKGYLALRPGDREMSGILDRLEGSL